jgi:hypothetical protein
MTSLQKKGVNFEWNQVCEESFLHLKGLLTSAPILNSVDPSEDFVVCTDACKEGLGGVLNHNGHIVFYESIKLKEHQRNHATHDLELETIIHALNIWSHWIYEQNKMNNRTEYNNTEI